MEVRPKQEVIDRLGRFSVLAAMIVDMRVGVSPADLVGYMRQVEEGLRRSMGAESLKEEPILRAYRDFFWRAGIDPTKTRPASEALIRRILRGNPLPAINSFVDALNTASVLTRIPFAAFDRDRISGRLELRFARPGERMVPIGHPEPVTLTGNEIVISDAEKVIALYPHRDSNETRITEATEDALIMSCGVPGVEDMLLSGALARCVALVTKHCGGAAQADEARNRKH